MKKTSPEVLIFIEKMKQYIKNAEDIREYFFLDIEGAEDIFINNLTEIAEQNFEKTGFPELTKEQFEVIREKVHLLVLETKKEIYEKFAKNSLLKKFSLN